MSFNPNLPELANVCPCDFCNGKWVARWYIEELDKYICEGCYLKGEHKDKSEFVVDCSICGTPCHIENGLCSSCTRYLREVRQFMFVLRDNGQKAGQVLSFKDGERTLYLFYSEDDDGKTNISE